MASGGLIPHPVYAGRRIALATKHAKGRAIAPAFRVLLAAEVRECELDTDRLGTFSGEVERQGDPLACARRKCGWGMDVSGTGLGLASEGSFGPHPVVPMVPNHHELLLFSDRERGLELHLVATTMATNYRGETVADLAALRTFAQGARFPSHALIVRPNDRLEGGTIEKGIRDAARLEAAFTTACRRSADGRARVETDMRAHCNPARMAVIAGLAARLAARLATPCPRCRAPGWGERERLPGLPCAWCGTPTDLVLARVFGCCRCDHEERMPRGDGRTEADPGECPYCNP